MRSSNYFPPTRRSRQRRRTLWIVLGLLAVLAVVLVVFPTGLSTGKHPNQTENTTATPTVSHVTHTYEAVLAQYDAALVAANKVIAIATDDIVTQVTRAQNDAASYNNHESGDLCASDALSPNLYQTCLDAEQQSAQSALGDENEATQVEKGDVSTQVASVQEIETAINAFAQQLEGITWPASVSPAVSSLTQALRGYRSAYAQTASDLVAGKPISTDSQPISAAGTAVATQLSNMARTLGIAPGSSPPPS